MEVLLNNLAEFGVMGIVLAIVMWQNHRITNRLFEVIEHNTEVMTRLTEIIESKVERRKD